MSSSSSPAMASLPLSPQALTAVILSILILPRDEPTPHEENVAVLEELGLRRLTPLPMSAVQAGMGPSFDLSSLPLFSTPAIRDLFNDADRFFATALLSPAEFYLLHWRLQPSLVSSRSHSQSTSPHLHLRVTALNTADQLLMWLLHIADEGDKTLALLFGEVHITTVRNIIDHVTWCVNTDLEGYIQWPTAEERKLLHGSFAVWDTAVAIIDGTHCEISEPTYDERVYYSGYKHKHTQNYLVCVNSLGVILHVEGPFPGRRNDRGVYNSSEIGKHPEQFFSEGERLLADGGFVGGGPLLVPIHSTIIDKATKEETKEVLREINQEVSDDRVLVEDVLGWIKARAHVLDHRYTRARETQAQIFYATCRLHNFVRLHRIAYRKK
jgi:hypothetical protein